MKRFLLLLFLAAFLPQLRGDDMRMTRVVVRLISPKVKPDSFASKPRVIYRVGSKYARTEEELDAVQHVQSLMITKEPDSWLINLADNTGRHIVDSGPGFDVRLPILLTETAEGKPVVDETFRDLEFGQEMDFFRANFAVALDQRKVEGRTLNVLSVKRGNREVVLLSDPATSQPFQIDVLTAGKTDYSLRYISFQANLPFKGSLFEPPKEVKMTNAK